MLPILPVAQAFACDVAGLADRSLAVREMWL
jgi:hypothetical protein